MKINFNGEELTGKLGQYEDGQKHLQLFDKDGCPYMTVSTNIFTKNGHNFFGGVILWSGNFAINTPIEDTITIKNYSENQGIEEALLDAGIIKKEDKIAHCITTFCEMNVYKIYENN